MAIKFKHERSGDITDINIQNTTTQYVYMPINPNSLDVGECIIFFEFMALCFITSGTTSNDGAYIKRFVFRRSYNTGSSIWTLYQVSAEHDTQTNTPNGNRRVKIPLTSAVDGYEYYDTSQTIPDLQGFISQVTAGAGEGTDPNTIQFTITTTPSGSNTYGNINWTITEIAYGQRLT